MSFFHAPVSNKVPAGVCNLAGLHAYITADKRLQQLTSDVRTACGDEKLFRKKKQSMLPYVTPAGVFPYCKELCLTLPSGLFVIAINLCRIMSVVALLRSLERLLPTGTRRDERDYSHITRQLLQCPGLTPTPDILPENVRDGVIPRFRLAITDNDFRAVLSLASPLYLHACHVLALLPPTETVKQPPVSTATFLDRLPQRFTRQAALEEAQRCGIADNTLDSLLKRMVSRGILAKAQRGEYRFASRVRACVCEAPARNASLQDSDHDSSQG